MTTVIKLYNPTERPFGALSNNSRHQMRIDGKVWNTVTNYIYANMLTTPLYRTILQSTHIKGRKKNTNIQDKVLQLIANQEARERRSLTQAEKASIHRNVLSEIQVAGMNIDQIFNMYWGREEFNIIRSAVEKAYNLKFSEDDELVHILLETGDAPIHYVSNNMILGGGPDGTGQNIVGLTLMQIRHNLRRQAEERAREEQVARDEDETFMGILANNILRRELREGRDIKQYLGKSVEEVIDIFRGQNDIGYVFASLGITPDNKQDFLTMYKRGTYPELAAELARVRTARESGGRPTHTLGLDLRKQMIRQVAKDAEERRKDAIFSGYVKYEAKRDHQDLDEQQLETAYRQLIQQAPSIEAYRNMRDRVVKLYTSGELSECCSEQIEQALAGIKVPSASDIEEAERSVISKPEDEEIVEESQGSSSSSSSDGGHYDPLKALFQSDKKTEKHDLIKRLQYYTGKPYRKYKDLDIGKLRKMIGKYESGKKERKGGKYQLLVKSRQMKINKANMVRELQKIKDFKAEGLNEAFTSNMERVSLNDIKKKLKKLASGAGDDGPVRLVQTVEKEWIPGGGHYEMIEERTTHRAPVFQTDRDGNLVVDDMGIPVQTGKFEEQEMVTHRRKWIPDPAMEPDQVSDEEEEQVEKGQYIKPHGEPIRIYANLQQNEDRFRRFPPNAPDPVEIDNVTFPSVSMFITASLLGRIQYVPAPNMPPMNNVRPGNPLGMRGALALLRGPDSRFVDIDRANQIYVNENVRVFKHRLQVYAKIGIWTKFEDFNLQDLLLMTENARLLWGDPTDIFLGAGTKEQPGENVVGKLLMEKREEIKQQRAQIPPVLVDEQRIHRFIQDDKFVNQWVYMRLADMCNVVYQVKHYLWTTQKLDEKIDAKFATTVLDTIYQPCNFMKMYITKINVDVPDYFVMMVANCGAMKYVPDKKLAKEIQELDDRIKQEKFSSEGAVALQDMAERHRDELAQLERESEDDPMYDDMVEQLRVRHKEEEQQIRREMGNPTQEDRALRNEREQEKRQRIKEMQRILTEKKGRRRDKERNYTIRLKDLAKVYWDRIVVMIYFLIKHIDSENPKAKAIDVKLAIAKTEMLNSKNTICTRILDDEQDNCIASALLNLLSGLEKFKTYYAEDIPLGIPDINLSASIIVNKEISEDDIADVHVEDEEQQQQFLEEPGDFDIPGDERGSVEFVDEDDVDNMDPYAGLEDELEEAMEAFDEPFEEESSQFEFNGDKGRKKRKKRSKNKKQKFKNVSSDELEIIKGELRNLDSRESIDDLDTIAKYFMNAIVAIKTAPMSKKVKTNRVNFFATIR